MNNCKNCGKTFTSKAGLTYHLEKAKNKCESVEVEVEKNDGDIIEEKMSKKVDNKKKKVIDEKPKKDSGDTPVEINISENGVEWVGLGDNIVDKNMLLKKISILENGMTQLGKEVAGSRMKIKQYENALHVLEEKLMEEKDKIRVITVKEKDTKVGEEMMNKISNMLEESEKTQEDDYVTMCKVMKLIALTGNDSVINYIETKKSIISEKMVDDIEKIFT